MNYELRILGFERQAQTFVFCREGEEVDQQEQREMKIRIILVQGHNQEL